MLRRLFSASDAVTLVSEGIIREGAHHVAEDKKEEINEMEASNLPDTELKTLVIWMLNELRGRTDKLSENFTKEICAEKER